MTMPRLSDRPLRTRAHVHAVYWLAVGLSLALFFAHAMLLFDAAALLEAHQTRVVAALGARTAGKVILTGAFFMLFAAHIAEAAIWALFLRWQRISTPFGTAFYFTATSACALGYGDIVLPAPWRQLGPLVAIGGVLMFGCSAAFLFVLMQAVFAQHLW